MAVAANPKQSGRLASGRIDSSAHVWVVAVGRLGGGMTRARQQRPFRGEPAGRFPGARAPAASALCRSKMQHNRALLSGARRVGGGPAAGGARAALVRTSGVRTCQIGCGWRFMPWSLGVLAIITPLINRLRSFFFVFFQRRNPALLLSGLGMAGGPTVAPANHSRVATTAKTAAWALEHQCHRPGLYSGLGARRTRFFWCFFS